MDSDFDLPPWVAISLRSPRRATSSTRSPEVTRTPPVRRLSRPGGADQRSAAGASPSRKNARSQDRNRGGVRPGKRAVIRVGSRCQPACQHTGTRPVPPLPLNHRVSGSHCPLVACGVSFMTTRPLPLAFVWVVMNRAVDQVRVKRAGAGAPSEKRVQRKRREKGVKGGGMSSKTVQDQRVAGRRRRRDLGSVRLSERDRKLLLLIAERYAISVDQLACLIGAQRTGPRRACVSHAAGRAPAVKPPRGGFPRCARDGRLAAPGERATDKPAAPASHL